MEDKSYAYITLVTTKNYINAALILNKSLIETKSKYPLIVGICEDVVDNQVKQILEENEINYYTFERIYYADVSDKDEYSPITINPTVANKIILLAQSKYDKYCYMDVDAVIFKNIDSVFYYKHGSMVQAFTQEDEEIISPTGHCGFFIFEPTKTKYSYFEYIIQNMPQVCDSALLEDIFSPVQVDTSYHIPQQYFKMIDIYDDTDPKNLMGAHFICRKKPWLLDYSETVAFSTTIIGRYYIGLASQLKSHYPNEESEKGLFYYIDNILNRDRCGKKSVVATYLGTANYLIGAIVLGLSVKKNSAYDFIIATHEKLYNNKVVQSICKGFDIQLEKIETSMKTERQINYDGSIDIGRFKQYSKILFIDADSYCIDNINDFFNYPAFSSCAMPDRNYYGGSAAFASVFMLCPNLMDCDFLELGITQMNRSASQVLGDTYPQASFDIRYRFLPDWVVHINVGEIYPIKIEDGCKIIHFPGSPKPWLDAFEYKEEYKDIDYLNKYLKDIKEVKEKITTILESLK